MTIIKKSGLSIASHYGIRFSLQKNMNTKLNILVFFVIVMKKKTQILVDANGKVTLSLH